MTEHQAQYDAVDTEIVLDYLNQMKDNPGLKGYHTFIVMAIEKIREQEQEIKAFNEYRKRKNKERARER